MTECGKSNNLELFVLLLLVPEHLALVLEVALALLLVAALVEHDGVVGLTDVHVDLAKVSGEDLVEDGPGRGVRESRCKEERKENCEAEDEVQRTREEDGRLWA